MKRIKKKLSERGEIYLTVSFGFVIPLLWKRVKRIVYAKKKMIVVILSMKYLSKLTD
jgi:hypothetical protein